MLITGRKHVENTLWEWNIAKCANKRNNKLLCKHYSSTLTFRTMTYIKCFSVLFQGIKLQHGWKHPDLMQNVKHYIQYMESTICHVMAKRLYTLWFYLTVPLWCVLRQTWLFPHNFALTSSCFNHWLLDVLVNLRNYMSHNTNYDHLTFEVFEVSLAAKSACSYSLSLNG